MPCCIQTVLSVLDSCESGDLVILAPTERGRYVPCYVQTVLSVLDSSESGDLGTNREREECALLYSNSSFCVGQQ